MGLQLSLAWRGRGYRSSGACSCMPHHHYGPDAGWSEYPWGRKSVVRLDACRRRIFDGAAVVSSYRYACSRQPVHALGRHGTHIRTRLNHIKDAANQVYARYPNSPHALMGLIRREDSRGAGFEGSRRVQGLGFRRGLGLMVQGLRVWDIGFRVWA